MIKSQIVAIIAQSVQMVIKVGQMDRKVTVRHVTWS
jgi:hypothetical protein